jgi:hypothetical protein
VVILDLPKKSQQAILNLILGLILLQVPIAVLQRYGYLFGAARTSGLEDFSGGTLGVNATGILSLLSMGIAGIMLNLMVFDRIRLAYLVTGIFVIVAPSVAEGKVAVLLLPIVVLVVLGLKVQYSSSGRWFRLIAVFLTAGALLSAIMSLMPILAPATSLMDMFSSPAALWLYLTSAGGDFQFAKFGRLTDLSFTVDLLGRSAQSFLFGFGPGAISRTGQAIAAPSTIARYLGLGIGGVQAATVLLEIGFLGAIAYLALLLTMAVGMMRAARMVPDTFTLLRITSFTVALALYLVGLFYTQPWWSASLSVSFWTFAGITWTNARKLDLQRERAIS